MEFKYISASNLFKRCFSFPIEDYGFSIKRISNKSLPRDIVFDINEREFQINSKFINSLKKIEDFKILFKEPKLYQHALLNKHQEILVDIENLLVAMDIEYEILEERLEDSIGKLLKIQDKYCLNYDNSPISNPLDWSLISENLKLKAGVIEYDKFEIEPSEREHSFANKLFLDEGKIFLPSAMSYDDCAIHKIVEHTLSKIVIDITYFKLNIGKFRYIGYYMPSKTRITLKKEGNTITKEVKELTYDESEVALKTELDLRKNPNNKSAWKYIDSEPIYEGSNIFIDSEYLLYIRAFDTWIPVEKDAYAISEQGKVYSHFPKHINEELEYFHSLNKII